MYKQQTGPIPNDLRPQVRDWVLKIRAGGPLIAVILLSGALKNNESIEWEDEPTFWANQVKYLLPTSQDLVPEAMNNGEESEDSGEDSDDFEEDEESEEDEE